MRNQPKNKRLLTSVSGAAIAAIMITAAGAFAETPTVAQPGHVQNGGGNSAPAAPTPRPTNTSPAPQSGAAQPTGQNVRTNNNTVPNPNANNASPQPTPANQRPVHGDRDHDHDRHNQQNNNGNEFFYGPGWYPYGGMWNDGWYNNGYNNGGNYQTPVYTPSNQPTPTPVNNGDTSATPMPPTQTAAGAAAQATNAVDKSPEMVAANNAVASAQQAYTTERERVLASLRDKPEYKDALGRKHEAAKDVTDAKNNGKPQTAVVDAANVKMDAGDEVTKMQEQAVATDEAAAAAKTRLASTIADRDVLRAKLMAGR